MHPSSPLPSPCTCLSSHRSTPVRPFPSLYRLLANPHVRSITSSASPPRSSHSLAVFCHLYASRLLGVVRAVRKAIVRTEYVSSLLLLSISSHLPSLANSGGAFGIIAAFIAYYVSLSELLASEAKAVTVLPIRAFYFFNFLRPPFVVHFLIIKSSPIMACRPFHVSLILIIVYNDNERYDCITVV